MEVKKDFKTLTNAGYLLKETPAPTQKPTSTPEPTKKPTPSPTPTKAPAEPRFCAEITELDGKQNWDFKDCSLPCTFNHSDCPEGMLCALTEAC